MTDDAPIPVPPDPQPPAPAASPPASATMAPATDHDPRHELIAAAERAACTGDRHAVLTYMRLKRSLA